MASFTIDTLREMQAILADFSPVPFFGSSKEIQADRAMKFTVDRRDYVGAHPDFWDQIPLGKEVFGAQPLGGIEIHNLDISPARRAEFYGALGKALGGHAERKPRSVFKMDPGA